MTTTVVKTIGTSSRDYSTLQAWEDACPADLVAVDQIWQGQCYNDAEFTAGLTVAGTTTDATRYKELTTAAGQSFSDNASVQTNALRYNQANGVAISVAGGYSTGITVTDINFRMSKVQVKVSSDAYAYNNNTASTAHVLDKCILQQAGSAGACIRLRGGTLSNSLLSKNSAGTSKAAISGAYGAATLTNCTIVRPTTYAVGGTAIGAGSGFTFTLKNVAVFGFTADTSGTISATTCYTDDATPSTGFTTVAYDTSTGSGFQNTAVTTADFRIKTGSALLDVGTTDTTYAATDIAGTSRPQGSAYDVGAWELVAGGGGNVSLSLTGQSLTANLGALSASITSSVTGNQTTLQQGTITANVSKTLTGQAISLVQGSVSSDVSTVITGQTVSLAQGSVTDASSGNVTKALSGQSLSVSQGALTASISLALNGQSIVLSGGSVSPAISSALAGQQSSVQQGTISANISAGLTGQAVVLSNGTVAQAGSDVTKALTGQQLSIALGVLLEKKTIARPSSDTTLGAWLPSAGSSLYATLDEVSPDDADYIYTNSVSTCKIALNAVADPLTSSGQVVSYRVWSPNSNGLTVRLMQGATEIASWTHTVLPTSPTTYQQALTAGQCDAITDYSTLAIQLESV